MLFSVDPESLWDDSCREAASLKNKDQKMDNMGPLEVGEEVILRLK